MNNTDISIKVGIQLLYCNFIFTFPQVLLIATLACGSSGGVCVCQTITISMLDSMCILDTLYITVCFPTSSCTFCIKNSLKVKVLILLQKGDLWVNIVE